MKISHRVTRGVRHSCVGLALALASFTSAAAGDPQSTQATGNAAGNRWVVPRTADLRPDLEGVWENNSATPLERPRQFADKPLLTDAELDSLKRRARERFTPESDAVFGDALYLALLTDTHPGGLGNTGTYSQNWLPDRYFEHRTSLIVDPADGRLPTPTAEGKKARTAAAGRFFRSAGSVQEMTVTDRCITYGFPDLFAAYMSVYRIVQTPQYVAIQLEKIHDTRIIPLDGRAHISSSLHQYLGDSRGHWDGDTLVVETTNFHSNGNPMGGYSTLSDQNLRLVERFRRTSSDTLEYTFTVDNPTMWTRAWTAVINWKRAKGEVYEYACHEGNYSLRGMLAGARADEAAGR